MKCINCGKELVDGEIYCSICGTKVEDDYSKQQQVEDELLLARLHKEQNKKEKRNLIISFALASLYAMSIGKTGIGIGFNIFTAVFFTCVMYGVTRLHPIKRYGNLLYMPVIGWIGLLVICALVGATCGWGWTFSAVFNWIRRKPLISRNKFYEMLEEGVLG